MRTFKTIKAKALAFICFRHNLVSLQLNSWYGPESFGIYGNDLNGKLFIETAHNYIALQRG